MLFYFSCEIEQELVGKNVPGAEAVVDKHWRTSKHKINFEGKQPTRVGQAMKFLSEEEQKRCANIIPMKPQFASNTDYEIVMKMGLANWTYSQLCELTHPNPWGSHMYYLSGENEAERDERDLWIRFVSLLALQYTSLVGESVNRILRLHKIQGLTDPDKSPK